MRRTVFVFLATVSFCALVSAGNAQSAAKDMGVLKLQDKWRVGTVEGQGSSPPYCAMVNRFDHDVVLAVARNGDGYGSLALDFEEKMFESGAEYGVSLTTGKNKPKVFQGRASGDQSLVVQIGQDQQFFDGITSGSALGVDMPALKASFALGNFPDVYGQLLECASALSAPALAGAENVTSETDLDREVNQVSGKGQGTQMAAAVATGNSLDALEAELEHEQKVESEKAKEESIKLAREHSALQEKIAAEKRAAEQIAQEKTGVERKLLATAGGAASAGVISSVGLTAREQEERQLAALSGGKGKPASEPASGLSTGSVSLIAEQDRPRQVMVAPEPVPVVPDVPVERVAAAKVAEVTVDKIPEPPKAAMNAEEINTGLSALEKERDSLQRQLDQALAFNAMTTPESKASAEKLAQVEAELTRIKSQADPELQNKYQKLAEDMGKKQESLTQLEERMRQLEADRSAEAARAAKAQADLAQAQAQMEEMKKKTAEKMAELVVSPAAVAAPAPEVVTAPVAQPAVTTSAPVSVPVPANRASAFLDKIMGYHRPGGTPRAEEPVSAKPAPKSSPIVWNVPAAPKAPEQIIAKAPEQVAVKEPEPPVVQAPAPEITKKAEVETPVVSQPVLAEALPAPEPEIVAEKPPEKVIELPPPARLTERSMKEELIQPSADLKKPSISEAPVMSSSDRPASAEVPSVALPSPVAETKDAAVMPLQTPPVSILSSTQVVQEEMIQLPPASAAQTPVAEAPATQQMASQPAVSSPVVAPVQSVGRVTLEELLSKSGVKDVRFVSTDAAPGDALRQWTASGGISGLYEQAGTADGNFDAQVQSYLDRYRQDCPGHLDVKLNEAKSARAGRYAPVAVSCSLPANSYSTSLVFVQNEKALGAILHTGYAADASRVREISEGIAQTLSGAEGFTPPMQVVTASVPERVMPVPPPQEPAPVQQVVNTPVAQAIHTPVQQATTPQLRFDQGQKKQLRFNIPPAPPAGGPGADEFATVVIE